MQRELFRKDIARQTIVGIFYVNGKRIRKTMGTFAQLSLHVVDDVDDDGKVKKDKNGNPKRKAVPIRTGKREEDRIKKWCWNRWEEVNAELLKGEKVKKEKSQSIRKLFQEWIDYSAATRAGGTLEYYVATANLFMKLHTDFPVADFSLRHVDKIITHLSEKGLSTATVNIKLKCLKAFLRWAHERDLIDKIPKIKLLTDDHKIPVTMDDGQVAALLQRISRLKHEAPNPFHRRCYLVHERFILVVGLTGCRRGEAFWLRWNQIDLDAGRITVRKQSDFRVKEGKEKILVMPPILIAYLKEQREQFPNEEFLLDNGKTGAARGTGLIYASPYGITVAIRRHLQELGIARAGLKPIHGFRAKWITDLYRHGFDLQTISQGAGHSRLQTTAGYLSDPGMKLKDAAQALSANWHIIGTPQIENSQLTD